MLRIYPPHNIPHGDTVYKLRVNEDGIDVIE